MSKGPIVIVEDDHDDCDMIKGALQANGIDNEFRCFDTPVLALRYLRSTSERPLLIISDINMPFMNGIEFRKSIINDEGLNSKLIPFVFLTTASDELNVYRAFQLCAQGYFVKPTDNSGLNRVAKSIVEYWQTSKHPKIDLPN